MTATTETDESVETLYGIIVGPDRAEAPTLSDALCASSTLLDDLGHFGYNRRLLRREVIITRDGQYDGFATEMARSGRR